MRLDELMEEKKKKIWIRGFLRRGAKRKPRDPEKERMLILMDYIRFKKYIEEGKFEIVDDRRYKLNL